jgi:hypothetical protein
MNSAPQLRSEDGLYINADSGLCTDYLNRFNEAIMLLEMLPAVPDSVEDFLAWRPYSYAEHFAASGFKNREAVIAAYKAADPMVRKTLDELADSMNAMLVATREAMKVKTATTSQDALAQCALAWVKPLVTRAGLLINGRPIGNAARPETNAAQSAVDALFDN